MVSQWYKENIEWRCMMVRKGNHVEYERKGGNALTPKKEWRERQWLVPGGGHISGSKMFLPVEVLFE